MANRSPLTDKDGEVRELTREDLKHFKPASEVLPAQLLDTLPKRGRPAKDVKKVQVAIRYDRDVLDAFRATGKGWQTRINDALREWLREHKPT